jgi:hypothetical protein
MLGFDALLKKSIRPTRLAVSFPARSRCWVQEKETPVTDLAARLRAILKQSQSVLDGSDPADAERHAKAISALVRAERDLLEFLRETQAAAMDDDEEACRLELQRRLALFADAERAGAPPEVLARIAETGSA